MARKQTTSMGQIRIIGGRWRGRKLPVIDTDGLRPTTDRLKETAFNWLQFELAGARVLDLFAGTGSLGIEALSRGASHAMFFEKDLKATQQLKENLARLDALKTSHIQQGDTLKLLNEAPAGGPFNLVFIDPPFHKNLLHTAVAMLVEHSWLASGARVYVETELEVELNVPNNWQLYREKKMGQSYARLFHVAN
ncbi:MAG TPA: 16S rRNA (guanine(966)-N(2))-methyltransferase RsmD [Aliidiomarina sp.]|nr:16S rRNA (guanine(966)-N(2))-methyltransferase RsmD [Aliidiomarina sp.]